MVGLYGMALSKAIPKPFPSEEIMLKTDDDHVSINPAC